MKKMIEFYIDHFNIKNKEMFVSGRCYQGPIRIGDKFECIYRLLTNEIENGYGPSIREGDQSISLFVESIITYQKNVNEIYPGMTGEIKLSGKGFELIKNYYVIGVIGGG